MKNKNGLNKFKTIAVAPMNTAVAAAHHCTHLVLQPFVTRVTTDFSLLLLSFEAVLQCVVYGAMCDV